MKNFLRFDVDAYFLAYEPTLIRIKELEEERDSIADSMSQNNEEPRVSGGEVKSQVEQRAERREKITKKIDELEEYVQDVNNTVDLVAFTEFDVMIIKEYFIENKRSRRDIERLAGAVYLSPATIYRKITEIRERVLIEKGYEGA